ncbi:MAG: GTP-binding protein [Polyangiaceae bacterium]|nr:GTP-binding protein [Polyangiaceae bacterium]
MRRFVIGTAGHVDHGKTTLVHALTGVDTDRLPEEKARGITIELGFAPWQIDPETAVSIIDVPGHRRLVHTMIAGATGIELVLLVVAADEGVMPQTREHIAACELLGVRRAVVAITKADRVERELAELAGEEVSELLRGRIQHDVVVCSAKTGEGSMRSAPR